MVYMFSSILTISIAINLFLFCSYWDLRKIEDKCNKLEAERDYLEIRMTYYKHLGDKLQQTLKDRPTTTNYNEIPEAAVKYLRIALKTLHPDRGGNAQDFIECNKIYTILKEKYKH